MWRLRSVVALAVLVGMMIFGLAVAYGGWSWNAQLDVEGVDVRTQWTVVDDPDGAGNYVAHINVKLASGAHAEIIQTADNERVTLEASKRLKCSDKGIQAVVKLKVLPKDGAIGSTAMLTIKADGKVLEEKTGRVGKWISQKVVIPAHCSEKSDRKSKHD